MRRVLVSAIVALGLIALPAPVLATQSQEEYDANCKTLNGGDGYTSSTTYSSDRHVDPRDSAITYPAARITTYYYYEWYWEVGDVNIGDGSMGVCKQRSTGSDTFREDISAPDVREIGENLGGSAGFSGCVTSGVVTATGPYNMDMELKDVPTARGDSNPLTLFTGNTPFGNNPTANWQTCLKSSGGLLADISSGLGGSGLSGKKFFSPLGRYIIKAYVDTLQVKYVYYPSDAVYGSLAGNSYLLSLGKTASRNKTWHAMSICGPEFRVADARKGWRDTADMYVTDCSGIEPPVDGWEEFNNGANDTELIECKVSGSGMPVYLPGDGGGNRRKDYPYSSLAGFRDQNGWIAPYDKNYVGSGYPAMEVRANNTLNRVDFLYKTRLNISRSSKVSEVENGKWGAKFSLAPVPGYNSPSLKSSGVDVNSRSQPYAVRGLTFTGGVWRSTYSGAILGSEVSQTQAIFPLNVWTGVYNATSYVDPLAKSAKYPGFDVAFAHESVNGGLWQVNAAWSYTQRLNVTTAAPSELIFPTSMDSPSVNDWGSVTVEDIVTTRSCVAPEPAKFIAVRGDLKLN